MTKKKKKRAALIAKLALPSTLCCFFFFLFCFLVLGPHCTAPLQSPPQKGRRPTSCNEGETKLTPHKGGGEGLSATPTCFYFWLSSDASHATSNDDLASCLLEIFSKRFLDGNRRGKLRKQFLHFFPP